MSASAFCIKSLQRSRRAFSAPAAPAPVWAMLAYGLLAASSAGQPLARGTAGTRLARAGRAGRPQAGAPAGAAEGTA